MQSSWPVANAIHANMSEALERSCYFPKFRQSKDGRANGRAGAWGTQSSKVQEH